ncbi:MAG: hypothetical protein LBI33_05570, partial [Propionibacteriaceae bacterium]|nr:hypothetical protein [Propionibacteriaceae bacterium]
MKATVTGRSSRRAAIPAGVSADMRTIIRGHEAAGQASPTTWWVEGVLPGEPRLALDSLFFAPGQDCALVLFTGSPVKEIHRRDFFKLSYVYYGEAQLLLPGGSTRLTQGEAVLTAPRLAHVIDIGPASCVASVMIRPRAITTSPGYLGQDVGVFADYFLKVLYGGRGVPALVIPRAESVAGAVRQTVEAMARDLTNQQSRWNLSASAQLTCLLVYLARGS